MGMVEVRKSLIRYDDTAPLDLTFKATWKHCKWTTIRKMKTVANVGSNEKGARRRQKAISLLEKLIKAYHNESSKEQLSYDEKGINKTYIAVCS
ncbi:hypothetical protein ACLB2K_000929 [Fragaria x ananassa]